MKKSPRYWWIGWLLIGPSITIAGCLNDAECPSGNRCLVARGYESRCASYMPPVNIAGKVQHPPLGQRDSGYPCQFNVDCAPGFACYKKHQTTVEGQCLQPR